MSRSIVLTAKQAEYIRNAHHRWNFAVGAVRSGKSHVAIQYVIPHNLLSLSKKKGLSLILGASKENIERNVLSPMRNMWGNPFVSEINTRNIATIFGERVYCIGAESRSQVSKIRGSEIKFCYCDEVCDISQDVFTTLKSRLSLPYSVCHAACNPASPEHYIKKFLDSSAEGVDIYELNYTLYDNPFLTADFVKSLETEYQGTVYYDRYIRGLWTKAEGLVYPMYNDIFEDDFDVSAAVKWCISCDYGTQNAFAALKWAQDNKGIWHCVDEYRYSGRDEGHQKTADDYAIDMLDFVKDVPRKQIDFIVDPSALSFMVTLRRLPDSPFRVIGANNSVADGIIDTASAIRNGTVKMSRRCVETRKELAGYVWDKKSNEDKPVKVNDHLMDALRYMVKTKQLASVRPHYVSKLF